MRNAAERAGVDVGDLAFATSERQEAWGDRSLWIVTGSSPDVLQRAARFLMTYARKQNPKNTSAGTIMSMSPERIEITVGWWSIGD